MRLHWFVLLGLTLSCDILTAPNPEYCEDSSVCRTGYVCHPILHRCEIEPAIIHIEPSIGPSSGNIDIKITGINFRQGTTVSFNGRAADVTALSAEELHVRLPGSPGTCGPVLVQVQTPEGYTAQDRTLFRYKYGSIKLVPVANSPTVDTHARSIVAARIGGDSLADLVVANAESSTLSLFRGVGDLSFTSMAAFSTILPADRADIADFDGDGLNDLVVSSMATFILFQGQPNLTFTMKNQYLYSNKFLRIGDFNLDKKPDLLLFDSLQNQIDLYTNQGGFAFTPKRISTLPVPASALAVADLGGDSEFARQVPSPFSELRG